MKVLILTAYSTEEGWYEKFKINDITHTREEVLESLEEISHVFVNGVPRDLEEFKGYFSKINPDYKTVELKDEHLPDIPDPKEN